MRLNKVIYNRDSSKGQYLRYAGMQYLHSRLKQAISL